MNPEAKLEKKCREYAESKGCRMPKWTSPGNNGVPDRILFLPGGTVLFLEFKTLSGKLRPEQERWVRWLGESGFNVFVVQEFLLFKEVVDALTA